MLQTLQRHFIYPIRDFIYPPVCITCDQLLLENECKVCLACWNGIRRIQPGDPTWIEIGEKFCAEGVVDDFVSCFLFEKEGSLQSIIHSLKYEGMKSLGILLGKEIGRQILSKPTFSGVDGVVPIPLHRLKRRERGYNQSEYLAKGITEITGIPNEGQLLQRKRYTETQTQLNLEQRKENVSEAFELDEKQLHEVEGRSFILVDDVITTGSTINACAGQLKRHGASKVFAASVALAQ